MLNLSDMAYPDTETDAQHTGNLAAAGHFNFNHPRSLRTHHVFCLFTTDVRPLRSGLPRQGCSG